MVSHDYYVVKLPLIPEEDSGRKYTVDWEGTPLWRGGEAVTKDGRVALIVNSIPPLLCSAQPIVVEGYGYWRQHRVFRATSLK